MRELEWRSTYTTGFPEVDDGHRRLLDIANEMIRSSSELDGGGRVKLAQRFVDALKQHFAEEEAFLRKIGYPRVDEHAGFHLALLKRAERFVQASESDWSEGAEEQFEDLAAVMMRDIWGGDLHFRTYLLEKGLGLE